jgi:tetratricopeptide (TPR) repeat protein
MPIDPYSPCPGGTGKKVKFCCTDLQQELDKVDRMLEGEQSKACLDYVRKLDEKYAGRPCLQSIRISLENAVGDHAAAHATLAAFLKQHPANPVALAEKALDEAAHGDPLAGIEWLQKALEICTEEMPSRVYDAFGALAMALLSAGHIVPARAHLQLQMGISKGRDERAVSALLQLEGSPTVPLPLKDLPALEPAPAGVPWHSAFQNALDNAQRGYWKKAADAWTALVSQASTATGLWRNLATTRSYLGDYTGAIEALRKLVALGIPQDDAVEAEALAQSLAKDEAAGGIDELSITYTIPNADSVQEKLAADRHFERLPLDTQPWVAQNEPPPRAAFSLLDRPLLASATDISIDRVPNQLGQLLLFGKQTDREARIELVLFRPELPATIKRLDEALGPNFGTAAPETVIGHLSQVEHALSWHWRLPDDTPEELRLKLSIEKRRELVLRKWPKLAQPVFGGRTAEQAATEPEYRVRVLAGIWLLQLSDADTGAETYNQLRRQLNLPEVGDLDPAGLDLNRVPLGRLSRFKPESLGDEQLKQAFNRAVVANFVLALRRLAPEVIKRPDLPVAEYKLSAYRLLVRYATNSDEALRLIDESRKLAEASKQSSAPWDLMELSFRIQRGEAPAVMQLIDHLQRQHGREPGVAQALVQLLVQTGLVGPDGRLNIGAAPAAAADTGKLWTPDAPQAAGEKKSSLWLPD